MESIIEYILVITYEIFSYTLCQSLYDFDAILGTISICAGMNSLTDTRGSRTITPWKITPPPPGKLTPEDNYSWKITPRTITPAPSRGQLPPSPENHPLDNHPPPHTHTHTHRQKMLLQMLKPTYTTRGECSFNWTGGGGGWNFLGVFFRGCPWEGGGGNCTRRGGGYCLGVIFRRGGGVILWGRLSWV